MSRTVYSIDAPDQPRLKVARLEIEAILAKHDVAGCIVLHTPGMTEFFYNIQPSYSVCWIDEQASIVRVKSVRDRDHGGNGAEQLEMQAATANMTAGLAGELHHAYTMFAYVNRVVSKGLNAEHTPAVHVPDLSYGNLQ